ncbi:MAG: Asp23/Gls24 family envelope stress response protein, partial [Candidatus Atribacteria bacterium]|nr:Asp23/Gls24 family envelope stress response protein [Candidatus Atribacteria bacterium]
IIGKREINKGVKVDIKDKTVSLEISVVIDIDTVLIEVAKNVQREVKKVIETKTGMTVNKVDVNIREVSYKEKDEAQVQ